MSLLQMDGWNGLPAVALLKVLRCLGNADVVSAGQTCRAWRTVTKLVGLHHINLPRSIFKMYLPTFEVQ